MKRRDGSHVGQFIYHTWLIVHYDWTVASQSFACLLIQCHANYDRVTVDLSGQSPRSNGANLSLLNQMRSLYDPSDINSVSGRYGGRLEGITAAYILVCLVLLREEIVS